MIELTIPSDVVSLSQSELVREPIFFYLIAYSAEGRLWTHCLFVPRLVALCLYCLTDIVLYGPPEYCPFRSFRSEESGVRQRMFLACEIVNQSNFPREEESCSCFDLASAAHSHGTQIGLKDDPS